MIQQLEPKWRSVGLLRQSRATHLEQMVPKRAHSLRCLCWLERMGARGPRTYRITRLIHSLDRGAHETGRVRWRRIPILTMADLDRNSVDDRTLLGPDPGFDYIQAVHTQRLPQRILGTRRMRADAV
jgi:hypothetical protein